MFFCLEPSEEIKLKKYYSKPRTCIKCKQIKILNYITCLCDECNQKYLDYLFNKINSWQKL